MGGGHTAIVGRVPIRVDGSTCRRQPIATTISGGINRGGRIDASKAARAADVKDGAGTELFDDGHIGVEIGAVGVEGGVDGRQGSGEADVPANLAGAQAFLVASPVAARALAARIGVRTFPVFADSAVTADTLRRLGFKQVEAANDARELANIVGSRLKPATDA